MKRTLSLPHSSVSFLTVALALAAFFAGGPLFARNAGSQSPDSLNAAAADSLVNTVAADSLNTAAADSLNAAMTAIGGPSPVDSLTLDPVREALLQRADSLAASAGERADSSDYKGAIELMSKALEIRREVLGERHPDCATALHEMATYHYYLRDYAGAIELGTEALEIRRETLGERHPDYAASLNDLCAFYFKNLDFAMAAELAAETVEVRREIFGDKDPLYAAALKNLATAYVELGDYGKAVEAATAATDIYREVLGPTHPTYAGALNSLAQYYANLGDYDKAVELGTEAAGIMRESLGAGSSEYADVLQNLSSAYSAKGDYDKAIEIAKLTVDVYRESLGERNLDYAVALSFLAYSHSIKGDYAEAIELGTESAEIMKEVCGPRHPNYAIALGNLSNYYDDVGNYGKCAELDALDMEIEREFFGERHPRYAGTLHNSATHSYSLGDYPKAIGLETEAAGIWKASLGERHPNYALALSNLAEYYSSAGDYDKALEFGMEALGIRKEVLGDRHPDYAASLSVLGTAYYKLGNYRKALELETESADIRREAYGDRHTEYAKSLYSMSIYHSLLGDLDKAAALSAEAAEIYREVYGDRNPQYAYSLHNLAADYSDLGDYEKALELEIEAADIIKETVGGRHPNYAAALGGLANYYRRLGDYDRAMEFATRALEIRGEALGESHPAYAEALCVLAEDYRHAGDYAKAIDLDTMAEGIYAGNVRNNFSFLTASERGLYWDSVKNNIGNTSCYSVLWPSDGGNALAYDVELLGKGILLSSEREFDKVIRSSGDEELMAKFERLRTDRLQLEVYYKMPVDERPADEVSRLEREAEQLERDLIAGSKEYGDFTRSLAIEWADVRDALRDNDLAIEFAKVGTDSTDFYVALMLRKGWDAPKCVNLGEADGFEPYLAMGKDALYRSREFSEKVWAGIVGAADLKEGDNVYFAPDGIFYQLGIEYLPAVGDEDGGSDGIEEEAGSGDSAQSGGSAGRIMIDKYNLRRLSSTKELCFEPSAVAESSAVLYGGLIYDADPEAQGAVGDARTEGPRQDTTVGMLLAQRGMEADTLARAGIKYLPGTLAEADTLATMLLQRNIEYAEYTGRDGTEESFKALTGNAPKLIHIATHGFYLSPTSAEIMSQQRHNDFLSLGEDRQGNAVDYSMSRSGLLFAGAQNAWLGEPVPAGADDGILTAQEIAGLDLRGVDLAVLSACSTANGEVTGDGVAGLQRGFKKAGVKTLLLTLWEVNDRATQLFMTKFYENLTSGKSKRQSFTLAQRYLRDYEDWIEIEIDDPDGEPVYDDTLGDWVRPTKIVRELGRPYAAPQYWAAFIMLD